MNKFMDNYRKITTDMINLCEKKNNDYGSSVQDTYAKFGDISYLVRITDKYNRICSLLEHEAQVNDEAIEDTIKDMANYCLLWLASKQTNEIEEDNEFNNKPLLPGLHVKVKDLPSSDWCYGFKYIGRSATGGYAVKDDNGDVFVYSYCEGDE